MAMIPNEDITHIRGGANIVNIISSYLNLEPKGKNFFGLCPFHDDHSPSMSVSPEKQIYTCFVCGATGNVFTFVQNYENVSFPEAVSIVASKIGYQLNYDTKTSKKDYQLYEVINLANKYYINNLNSAQAKNAKTYLKKRNLSDEIINEFGIGVAFNDNNLTKLLLSKGYDEKLIIMLGLANKTEELYDVFRNRITFPINNEKGEVVAFSARIYNNEEANKYINSKESLIFKKSNILFNYDKARLEAGKNKSIILVEGQMDAIRLYASGIKNVVATMGTALTKEHVSLLKKLNVRVLLLFDNDEAGEKSTIIAGNMLETAKVPVGIVRISGEKDPDDYLVKNGVEALQDLLKNPLSFFDFKINCLKKNKDLNKSEDLAIYVNNILAELNKSNDDILKEITINKLHAEFGLDKALLLSKVATSQPVVEPEYISPKPKEKLTKYKRVCETLLYIMMSDVKYIKLYERTLGYVPDKEYGQLANDILAYYKINKDFNLADFISFETRSPFYETLMHIINEYEAKPLVNDEFEEYINLIKKWTREEQTKELKAKLKLETDITRKQEINDLIIKLKKESDE